MTGTKTFSAHGKFLLTAEYLVLKGATALAIPLRMRQDLQVTSIPQNPEGKIYWTASDPEKIWFEAVYDIKSQKVIQHSDADKAAYLEKLLNAAHHLNPLILNIDQNYKVETTLGFRPEWGLGSSSTLISNVARWFDIDPFDLHFAISNGSGYDIACATAETPLFYTLSFEKTPFIETADFYPPFADRIFFVYSGRKQQSEKSVLHHYSQLEASSAEIIHASNLSKAMAQAATREEFEEIINEHNQMMSRVLRMSSAADSLLPGFPGAVKWLGAWGGDFVMVTWQQSLEELKSYLKNKGLTTVFAFQQMVPLNNVIEKRLH
jgi:mevalonate kinase